MPRCSGFLYVRVTVCTVLTVCTLHCQVLREQPGYRSVVDAEKRAVDEAARVDEALVELRRQIAAETQRHNNVKHCVDLESRQMLVGKGIRDSSVLRGHPFFRGCALAGKPDEQLAVGVTRGSLPLPYLTTLSDRGGVAS